MRLQNYMKVKGRGQSLPGFAEAPSEPGPPARPLLARWGGGSRGGKSNGVSAPHEGYEAETQLRRSTKVGGS